LPVPVPLPDLYLELAPNDGSPSVPFLSGSSFSSNLGSYFLKALFNLSLPPN